MLVVGRILATAPDRLARHLLERGSRIVATVPLGLAWKDIWAVAFWYRKDIWKDVWRDIWKVAIWRLLRLKVDHR